MNMMLVLAFVFAVGSVICHQRPERSFFVDGHQLPVCARCTGLYLSGVVGLLGWVVFKIVRRWHALVIEPRRALAVVLIAAVPTVVSVASGSLGMADGTNLWRAMLAVPLGISAGAVVAAVATKDLR